MTLNKFINLNDPYYDFKLEYNKNKAEKLKYKSEDDDLLYMIMCCANGIRIGDDTFLAHDIYYELIGGIFHVTPKKNEKLLGWSGDTMNSFCTPFNYIFKEFCNKPEDYKYMYENNKYWVDWEKINDCKDWKKEIDEELYSELEKFAKLCSTIGNFMPVPKGPRGRNFNSMRKAATNDFWDLTLLCIKNYYCSPVKYTKLCETLHTVERIGKWLNRFSGWDNFIEINHLQDYVDKNNNWRVIDLFDDIAKKTPLRFEDRVGKNLFPTKEKQIPQYFKNVNYLIKKRGERIVAEMHDRYCRGTNYI